MYFAADVPKEDPKRVRRRGGLLNRIKTLYHQALKYYKEDLDLWSDFIKILIRFQCVAEVSTIYSNITRINRCYSFMVLTLNSMSREILERGLEKHPMSSDIAKAYILFLLESAGLKKATDEAVELSPEHRITITNAIKVFDSSATHLKEIRFYIDLVKALEEFERTEQFQDKVLHHILTVFPNKEELYDFMAERHLNGFV